MLMTSQDPKLREWEIFNFRDDILLPRGPIAFSITKMAKHLHVTRETLRKHLGWLALYKIIRLQTYKEGTVVELIWNENNSGGFQLDTWQRLAKNPP